MEEITKGETPKKKFSLKSIFFDEASETQQSVVTTQTQQPQQAPVQQQQVVVQQPSYAIQTLLDSIDGILDDIFEEMRKNPSTQPHYQREIPHIETNKKHINDLKIGDDVVIFIPTVTIYIGKVSFINIEKQFIFVDGDIDDEEGFPKYADKDGYYDVPV